MQTEYGSWPSVKFQDPDYFLQVVKLFVTLSIVFLLDLWVAGHPVAQHWICQRLGEIRKNVAWIVSE
jgi:hypothetical protein